MSKTPISFPRTAGEHTRQAHADFPAGSYEREFGKEGFFGAATHLYHKHPPTSWLSMDGPLRPRAFDYTQYDETAPLPWDATPMLHNTHVNMRFWRLNAPMPSLASNADGDELLFIHEGAGELFCDFGHLTYRDGDYIMLPRCSMWRLEPAAPTSILLIEATNSGYMLPDKGMMGPHAIFDPAMLDVPALDDAFRAQQTETETAVIVKRRNQLTTITYPYNPLDTVGWKGDNLPVRVNWRDIRPLMSHRYHVPPSAHTTFLSQRFVVCTFVPRPIESDPGALKVPFYHSNNDYDEVIFYHRGEFFSRDNIHPGMVTFHPSGFIHGPHPGAFKKGAAFAKKETDEVAVMIDTRDPLEITEAATNVEWQGYVHSWKEKK